MRGVNKHQRRNFPVQELVLEQPFQYSTAYAAASVIASAFSFSREACVRFNLVSSC
eukprot:m.192795 g.192795  ORF g.192795 m.192795 type:complete len:56 (+) comp16772_c2_seq2:878-1045(+)